MFPWGVGLFLGLTNGLSSHFIYLSAVLALCRIALTTSRRNMSKTCVPVKQWKSRRWGGKCLQEGKAAGGGGHSLTPLCLRLMSTGLALFLPVVKKPASLGTTLQPHLAGGAFPTFHVALLRGCSPALRMQ